MPVFFRIPVTIFYVVCLLIGHAAQAVGTTDDVELAKQLKEEYPEASVVALRHYSVYEFGPQQKKERLMVSNTESTQLITLRGNTSEVFSWFYDNDSSLDEMAFTGRDGRRIPTQKICGTYESENVFYSDAKICRHLVNLSRPGDPLHIQVRKTYTDARYLTKVFFHENFPVVERELIFRVPDWVDVQFVEVNCEGYQMEKSTYRSGEMNVHQFKLKKQPSTKVEENSTGFGRTYPHILVLTKSFHTTTNEKKAVLSSVSDLYNWYQFLNTPVNNDSAILKPAATQIIAGATSDLDKVKKIFYWVQDNIRYIAFEDGIAAFKPEDAHIVYQNKFGDCKGMANLTTALLKEAGLDARLCWIGTRRVPYTYETPSLAVNNHMICAVYLQGKRYFLDPTEKFSALGAYAERIQGKQVLIENGDAYILDQVPVSEDDSNQERYTTEFFMEKNQLKGNVNLVMTGESGKDVLNLLDRLRKDLKDKAIHYILTSGDNNIVLDSIRHSSLTDREKDISVSYTALVDNHIQTFGTDVFVDLDMHKKYADLILKEDRVSDYAFDNRLLGTYKTVLHIPAGYQVKHLPADLTVSQPEFSFKITFRHEKNTIVYEKELRLRAAFISKKNFSAWNAAIRQLTDAYNDQIILSH